MNPYRNPIKKQYKKSRYKRKYGRRILKIFLCPRDYDQKGIFMTCWGFDPEEIPNLINKALENN